MWNRVNLIYLIACACVLSSLSMHPASHNGARQFVILIAALVYPPFLMWLRPKTGFWKGAVSLISILTAALLCGFATYLLWYVHFQYKRLGSEFYLFEVLGWSFGESFAFFLFLDVCPAAIIVAVCYPVGYLLSFQIFRRIRSLGPSYRS
jgi:hypothetical protein